MNTETTTERTFQGVLITLVNGLVNSHPDIGFSKMAQELNVGVGEARFSDCILFSNRDVEIKVYFELKNTSWDATDEVLVNDAARKAFARGIDYFVTGTPRQLVLYQTYKQHTLLSDRKLRLYFLSNIKRNDEVLSPSYERLVVPRLLDFLKNLNEVVHGLKPPQWDSIDRFFVNKLSAYILEASANMLEPMEERIGKDEDFRARLKQYLTSQDLFNINLGFGSDDIYKICQLANYLLFLKILFYSYLQKDVPALRLVPLEIPEQQSKLNQVLRKQFDDVLQHDFELIFAHSVLDEFVFGRGYIPVLKRNLEEMKNLNYHELDCDIIGSIYNTLIDNQEQHDRGQHFTNTNEVDIVNAFCINPATQNLLDSGCGAGTFLVRGYSFLKAEKPRESHTELLERLWGVEIAPFPTFLATMNLCLMKISEIDNYPVVVHSDFSEVSRDSRFKMIFQNYTSLYQAKRIDDKYSEVAFPIFDACIGNPPYIRQELIENKERWINLANLDWGYKKFNRQSDLYVYYLMHTAAFLKEGGRLGYVISDSWLDVAFGRDLQKFLLDKFKIIAIISHDRTRSFETALITTVVLVLERCQNREKRQENTVRFVRVFKDYGQLIGGSNDADRLSKVKEFARSIEGLNSSHEGDDFTVIAKKQKLLEEESTIDGKYENGFWGATYFRSPKIFAKILTRGGRKLMPLRQVVDVRYGIKTGANEFFYVIDETHKVGQMSEEEYELTFGVKRGKHKADWRKYGWYYSEMSNRHYVLERRYFKPIYKSQREASGLSVDPSQLKYRVLLCDESKASLRKFQIKLASYISEAESKSFEIQKRATCAGRISADHTRDWFHIWNDAVVSDFIFPAKIGEYCRIVDNREARVYCDKVSYNILVKEEFVDYANHIFLILNSTLFRFFIDLFSRQMVVNVSDVDVNIVQRTLIVDPRLLKKWDKELNHLRRSLMSREQGTLYEEVKQKDRRRLDEILFEVLGLDKSDLDELYGEACKYIEKRSEKAASIELTKEKTKLDYTASLKLIRERFSELSTYHELISEYESKTITIPNLKARFPSAAKTGSSNLFGHYDVYFKDANQQTIVRFDNPDQLALFEFLHQELEVKGLKLRVPITAAHCGTVLQVMRRELQRYLPQIKATLKSYRSKANEVSIYRDLVLS